MCYFATLVTLEVTKVGSLPYDQCHTFALKRNDKSSNIFCISHCGVCFYYYYYLFNATEISVSQLLSGF